MPRLPGSPEKICFPQGLLSTTIHYSSSSDVYLLLFYFCVKVLLSYCIFCKAVLLFKAGRWREGRRKGVSIILLSIQDNAEYVLSSKWRKEKWKVKEIWSNFSGFGETMKHNPCFAKFDFGLESYSTTLSFKCNKQ